MSTKNNIAVFKDSRLASLIAATTSLRKNSLEMEQEKLANQPNEELQSEKSHSSEGSFSCEGSLSCEGYLSCEGPLPSEEYNCDRVCRRKCPNGHTCKDDCTKKCGPCYYVITVQMSCVHSPNTEIQTFCWQRDQIERCQIEMKSRLNCGHYVRVACSADLSQIKCRQILVKVRECGHGYSFECWENIPEGPCPVPVVKTFACGHEMILTCDEKTRLVDLQCYQRCDVKLPCGHLCGKLCHIAENPSHDEFQCMEPCDKFCARGLHRCDDRGQAHPCYLPCNPCTEDFEFHLQCDHGLMMKCNEPDPDQEEYFCKEKCLKMMPFCLHLCQKLCGEDCGACQFPVKKYAENCPRNHYAMVPCQVRRDKLCKVKVPPQQTPDCGHKLLVYCYEADTITKNELAEICNEPCSYKFELENECGHQCVGNCRDCFQGRFHMRCQEPCGRVLICGHNCLEPCRMICPPCHHPCFNSCEHGQCELECGVPCVRQCEKPCPYECQHLKCTRKCFEVCDRQGCKEPCPKMLECGHSCCGFCGEPCPPLCVVCTPDKLLEGTFSGNTTLSTDNRFIYLPDCGHCVESSDFDHWISTEPDEILPIRCPVCNGRLNWIRRYSAFFSKNQELVQSVRVKIFGKREEIEGILNEVVENVNAHVNANDGQPYFNEYVEYILQEVVRPIYAKPKLFEPTEDEGKEVKLQSVSIEKAKFLQWICAEWINASKILTEFYPKLRPDDFKRFYGYWEQYIIDMAAERVWPMHYNEITELEIEGKRMEDLTALFTRMDITTHPGVSRLLSTGNASYMLRALEKLLRKNKPYDQTIRTFFRHQIKEIDGALNCTVNVTEREREEIVAAFGAGSGRWFKCVNGHVYVITECGGATEVGKCNECGAEIGGANHMLLEDNYLATEMDGATQPLYPTALVRNNNANQEEM